MSDRSIGIGGAVATIVGFVIGVSVFVLPGNLAASAGPAVVLTYVIASLLGLLSCVVAAQVGVCYPTAGASFVAVADLLGDLWGFLLVWLLVGASAVGIGLLAYGLADYLGSVISVNRGGVAFASVLLFTLINVCGVRASTAAQVVLVIAFLAALVVFVTAGIPEIDSHRFQPFLANGWSPVLLAVLPAYFSYAGFMVIIELAGEIRRPERTIPVALLISFVLVLVTYMLVALTLVGLIPWTALGDDPAPVGTAAALVLPDALASAITLTAVAAAASSINGVLLGYSRDVHALADRGMLPRVALIHARWMDSDSAGVMPISVVALIAVAAGSGVEALAIQAVMGVLLVQCLLGLALLRLPTRRTHIYAMASFRLPRPLLVFFALGLVVTSVLACAAVIATSPAQAGVALVYITLGCGLYWMKTRNRITQR